MKDTQTFLKVLDPEDTSTGGGSAAAISGAMAAALIAMVSLLCAKSPGIEDGDSFCRAALQAQELSDRLLAGGTEDTRAFQALRSVFKLPKGSAEERHLRSQTIQAAWIGAARVPLENAALCLQAALLGVNQAGQILPQFCSDWNCAILLARAGFWGCLENVVINLPSIRDQTIASQLAEQAAELRARLASLDRTAE